MMNKTKTDEAIDELIEKIRGYLTATHIAIEIGEIVIRSLSDLKAALAKYDLPAKKEEVKNDEY